MRLRTQLTLTVTVLVALVVASAGLFIVLRIDHRDRDDLDRVLTARADRVRAAAVKNGSLPTDGTFAIRLISDGEMLKQVGSSAGFPLPVSDGFSTVSSGDDEWRSRAETLVSGAQLQILISLDDLKEQHDDNVLVVDLLVLLAAVLSAAGVWFATGLVLRPFQRLLTAARDLDPADPDQRLPEVTSPREVAELTTALNDLIARTRSTPMTRPTTSEGPAGSPVTRDPAASPTGTPVSAPSPTGTPVAAASPTGAHGPAGSPTGLPGSATSPTVTQRTSTSPSDDLAKSPSVTKGRGTSPNVTAVPIRSVNPDAAPVSSGAGDSAAAAQAAIASPTVEMRPVEAPIPQTPPEPASAPQPAPMPDPVPAPELVPEPETVLAPEPAPMPESAPVQTAPAFDPAAELGPSLAGLGVQLDQLMDNPDMPATQRHLLLAQMADEHRRMVAVVNGDV